MASSSSSPPVTGRVAMVIETSSGTPSCALRSSDRTTSAGAWPATYSERLTSHDASSRSCFFEVPNVGLTRSTHTRYRLSEKPVALPAFDSNSLARGTSARL